GAEKPAELVGGLDAPADQLVRPAQVPQVAHPDAAPPVLVLIGGADAAAGRADFLPSFAGPVEELVERERQVRAVRYVELVLRPDAPLTERVELREERLRIEHDAVADQAHRTLNDPRGNLVQHELPGAGVDRVARVRPALIAHDQIGALGEHVDDLPFAPSAPLGAADPDPVVLRSEHGSPAKPPRNRALPDTPAGTRSA